MLWLTWCLAAEPLLPLPTGEGSLAPHLLRTSDGLRLTWMEGGQASVLRSSAWTPTGGWSKPARIAGGDLFVNWADTPVAAVAGDGSTVVAYPRKSAAGTYAYDVRMARSSDGVSWEDIGSPHQDGTPTEHGFSSMIPEEDGFRIFWLDGRNTASGGPMGLRTAAWAGEFSPSEVVDDRVCDCCGTSAVRAPTGWTVAYRNRTEDELRDIRVSRGEGEVVVGDDQWQMPGCPVNGPRVAQLGKQSLVAWTTGAPGGLEVRVAAGPGFEGRVLAPKSDNPEGRVDIVALKDRYLVSWLGEGGVDLSLVSANGSEILAAKPTRVASAPSGRKTGFPRTAVVNDEIIVVWTDPERGVVGVTRPVGSLPAPSEVLKSPAKGDRTRAITARPDLAAITLEGGKPWKLSTIDGPVLVALWASWCGPCRAELPALREVAEAHPELELIVIAVDDQPVAVRKAARDRPGTWVLADREAVNSAFQTSSVPSSWLFDRQGALQWSGEGKLDPASLPDLR